MKKMKRWPIVAGIIVLVLAVTLLWLSSGLTQGAEVSLGGVNLAGVADGSYTGKYDFKRWSNTVTVHVSDQQITAIDIERDVLAKIPGCAEKTFDAVIAAQGTAVDAVSGATVTSKAYLKAIENALAP